MVTARLRLVPLLALLAAVAFSAGRATPSSAAVGDLDEGFGVGGVATTDLGWQGHALALQDDGKIVVTGRSGTGNLVVVRFNSDGSLDTSFGNSGAASTELVGWGVDIAVAPGGKLVAVGDGDEHLVRLNPDGSFDISLAGSGITGSQFFNPYDPDETYGADLERVLPMPGGDTLIAGWVDYGPYFFTFARYNANGALDSSFGDAGQVQTDFTGEGSNADQEPLAVAPSGDDGAFFAAGWREPGGGDTTSRSVIARYRANGTLDPAFGDDGQTTTDFFSGGDDAIMEIFPLNDGRILAIGEGDSIDQQGMLVDTSVFAAMYEPDGTLSTGFGSSGSIIYSIDGYQHLGAAAMAPDGKILIGGDHSNPPGRAIFLLRLNPNGTPDTTFGPGGMRTYDIPGYPEDLWDLAVAENGDIFGAGSASSAGAGGIAGGGGQVIAVFKFEGTAGTPRDFGDADCNGAVNSVDSLKVSRHVAALSVAQTEPCPDIGTTVDIESASPHPWGDVDCDNDVDSVDALKLLRYVAALPVSQTEPCPDVGSDVAVSEP